MTRWKLTEMQRDKLRRAHKESSDVLREIKTKQLSGSALKDMKTLEDAVCNLESLVIK